MFGGFHISNTFLRLGWTSHDVESSCLPVKCHGHQISTSCCWPWSFFSLTTMRASREDLFELVFASKMCWEVQFGGGMFLPPIPHLVTTNAIIHGLSPLADDGKVWFTSPYFPGCVGNVRMWWTGLSHCFWCLVESFHRRQLWSNSTLPETRDVAEGLTCLPCPLGVYERWWDGSLEPPLLSFSPW